MEWTAYVPSFPSMRVVWQHQLCRHSWPNSDCTMHSCRVHLCLQSRTPHEWCTDMLSHRLSLDAVAHQFIMQECTRAEQDLDVPRTRQLSVQFCRIAASKVNTA